MTLDRIIAFGKVTSKYTRSEMFRLNLEKSDIIEREREKNNKREEKNELYDIARR